MYSFQWTVKAKRQVGKLPAGAWVEIIKTNTTAKPTPFEIIKAFESKYDMRIPNCSHCEADTKCLSGLYLNKKL